MRTLKKTFTLACILLLGMSFDSMTAQAQTFAYVANRNSNDVSVIATASNMVVATVGVGSTPQDVAITPDGAFAYVPNQASDDVSVIATASNTVVATVAVGLTPKGVAITPDGAFAYVTNSFGNDVSVIATASNTVVAIVAVGLLPKGIAITPDGAFAYVTNQDSDDVSVIATASNTVVATVAVGSDPRVVAVTPDGAFAYVTNSASDDVSVVATASNTVVDTIAVGILPKGIAFTPDGAFAYVANQLSNDVSVIATATNTVTATVVVGNIPRGVAITPDGAFAYVTNVGTNNVSVIATASNTVVATVAVGSAPRAVAITPAQLGGQSIAKVRHFDTWNGGIVRSTDPAGIGYHPASGHLYIADSEINELPVFVGDNVFEVSLLGNQVFREIQSNNTEPTGITFNEFDGFFYVTNDDTQLITRYDSNLNNPLASVKTSDALPNATDPEGITSDPGTGLLYVVDGINGGCQVLIYDSNLVFQGSWTANQFNDPEGIAFNPDTGNLFLVSSVALKIVEVTVGGTFIADYDISGFLPKPISPQGLTFAPTSDPNDPANDLAIYIADGMVDNFADGRIYEAIILTTPPTVNITVVPAPGDPVIIPASGLIFSFDVSIENNGTSTLNAQTWNKVSLLSAGGEEVGPVAGIPVMNVTVAPGGSFNTTIILEVPAGVPVATYPFHQIVGTFPNVEFARDTFTFIKSAGPTIAGADDWGLSPSTEVRIPDEFTLGQNYPNPFNPSTTIRYQLSRAENVSITVYDLSGRQVRQLVNEYQVPGSHLVRWDGKDGQGRHLASGIYFYQAQIGHFLQSRPMTLIK